MRDGFISTLLLVSASPKPLDFVLAVHSRSGQTLLAPGMTIQPQEKLTVDLAVLLASLSADITADFSEGSVSVYFSGTFMPLAGQLTMSNPAKSLSLESEMVDNSPGLGLLPATLNALWWGLGGGRDARIMVSNTSGDPVAADVFLDFRGERHQSTPLSFGPHETKVLSVSQLLGELKVSPAQAPEGGITIIPRGPKPALIGQGKITDPATGFSTSLNFMHPALQKASALHASGVPIGLPSNDSPFAGVGVFIPHVIVRNLTGSAQTATITVEYPGEKAPQQTALAPLALGPYATEDFSFDSVFGMLPLPLPYCSIRIQYSGPPGTVIGEVSSIESKGDMVIDSRLANEGDGWAGSGANPWHLDEETESILFLSNMGDRECPIGFQVQAGGVAFYLTDLSLKPRETRAIDFRKLRDAQETDFRGNRIPAGATDGSVLWIRGDNVPVMGRLVVLQRHRGLASNYDCDYCPCPPDLAWWLPTTMTPTGATVTVGGTKQFYFKAKFVDCNENIYTFDRTGAASWSSSNTAVATVSNGHATGKGGGTATITAQVSCCHYDFETCIGSPTGTASGTATVNVLTATITVRFSGTKTAGNNLSFPSSQTCSQNLGLLNCAAIARWVWNVEIRGDVSDDASNWTPLQSFTGRKKGQYRDSAGALVSFDNSLNVPGDNPSSQFVQQPSGQKIVFWIDAPGHTYNYDNGRPIDSLTQVQNFTSKVCHKVNTTACGSVNWYVKLVVKPGAILDTLNSKADFGSASTNF